jgi:alpha-1,2-mannosyltransferase
MLRPTRAQVLAAVAWTLALAAIGYLVMTAVTGTMLDLHVYRSGGQAILHGANLYAIRAADNLPFTYPPVSAILSVPLALLPFVADKIGWIAVVLASLMLAVRAGFRQLLDRAGGAAPAVFPVILAIAAYLQPVMQGIGFGQVDLVLLGLCLTDCMATAPRWPRGLLIGLATAIKLTPGVFVIYLLITGRRRAAGIAALSFAGLTALAWGISPANSATYWTNAIFQTGRLGGNGSAANQSLRGIVLRVHADVAPNVVWLPLVLIVGIAGFAMARACQQRGQELAGITITGLLGALLSPVGWIHHLCWVVLAIGVVTRDGRVARRVLPAALTTALFLSILPTWVEHTQSAAQQASIPGFLMENSFGLTALALIPLIYWLGHSGSEVSVVTAPAEAAPFLS